MADETPREGWSAWAIFQWIALPFAAGLGFVARALYFEGFGDRLGVPPELSLTPPWSLSEVIKAVIISVLVVHGVVRVFLVLHAWLGRYVLTEFLVTRAAFCLGAGAWMGFGLGAVRKAMLISIVVWIVLILAELLVALRYPKGTPGYLNRLDALVPIPIRVFASPPDPIATRLGSVVATNSVAQLVFMLVAALLVLSASAYWMGHRDAYAKSEWVIVTHPNLPALNGERAWVMVGKYGEQILTAPMGWDRRLTRRFVLLNASDEGPQLQPEAMGDEGQVTDAGIAGLPINGGVTLPDAGYGGLYDAGPADLAQRLPAEPVEVLPDGG